MLLIFVLVLIDRVLIGDVLNVISWFMYVMLLYVSLLLFNWLVV